MDGRVQQCHGKAVSLSNTPGIFGMYLGKYLAKDVEKTSIPTVISKKDAIEREVIWTAGVCQSGSVLRVVRHAPYRCI